MAKIHNVHAREIAAPVEVVGELLETLGSADDRVWATDIWVAEPVVFDRPLAVGAAGGHGSIRYSVVENQRGRRVVFRFSPGGGLSGTHGFELEPVGPDHTRITHFLDAQTSPWMRPLVAILIGWHDAMVETAFDRVELEATGSLRRRTRIPRWLRIANRTEIAIGRALGKLPPRGERAGARLPLGYRLFRPARVLVPAALAGIAGMHAAWALGWRWPGHDDESLAERVVGAGAELPPEPLVWVVAGLLGAAATVVAAVGSGRRDRLVRAAAWSVAGVLLVRGAAYIPIDLAGTLETEYARLDLAVYSPLSLALGVGAAIVARGPRPEYDAEQTRPRHRPEVDLGKAQAHAPAGPSAARKQRKPGEPTTCPFEQVTQRFLKASPDRPGPPSPPQIERKPFPMSIPKSSVLGRVDADRPHRVVVIGGGFAGLQAVRALRRAPVEVTLVDRRNFHLFQPLLYQVATGALAAAEIASPLRALLKRQRNARVVLGEVSGFDLRRRRVLLDGGESAAIDYDTLVVAAGASHAYFGHDEWRHSAPGLKSLEDAIEIRRRILTAFEAAELETDPARRRALLTFVVVGGGPTGVELAGQIAEIARDTLRRDFRHIDPRSARILLVEAGARLLGAYTPALSARAARALERLGVTALEDHTVVDIRPDAVGLRRHDGATERIPTHTVVWAAGVRASGLAGALARAAGASLDQAGRLAVGPDLTLAGHPEVLALGDMVRVHDADGHALALPGVAPVAMQQGRYAAKAIRTRLKGREPSAFHYLDKGNVATIGRRKAIADVRGLPLSGTLAWLTWLFVHLFYLVGLQNRVLVFIRWAVSFLTRGRGARLITGESTRAESAALAA